MLNDYIDSGQDEVIRYVTELDSINPSLRWTLYRIYHRNALYSIGLTPIALFNKKLINVSFIFYGSKYTELILSLQSMGERVGIIGGPKQLLFCLRHGIPFLSNIHAWYPLANLLKGIIKKGRIGEMLKRFAKSLDGKEGRYLIVDNDSVPMQRFISMAGEIAGIRTIYIQDGLFQRSSPDNVILGRRADFVFSYDEAQSAVFISKGISADKVRVMGYYLTRHQSAPSLIRRDFTRKVCFLGQPWGSYREELGNIYVEETLKIIDIVRNNGIDVYFKPHPLEKGSSYLSYFTNVVDMSMSEVLINFDVFISYTSTALYEATLYNRTSIQVWDPIFESDRFDALGYTYSLPLKHPNFNSSLIDLILNAKPVILKQPDGNLSERFLRCVSTL